jgi:fructan beta-fructosidase
MIVLLSACQTKAPKNPVDQEAYRPVYHFTPPSGWMNDPNGMFFYDGAYHLFYQHYPSSQVWGPMHWGHAVSTNMLTWEHQPIALYPDSLGYIFSGSAVVDWKNTSGLGSIQKPPVVAVFTYHELSGEQAGGKDFQTQGIAFSLDKGQTWTKYNQNPVLLNPGINDFRDPKVSWNEKWNKWIMTLAVRDHIEFYESPDLKKWSKLSEFGKSIGGHGGVWECPDLFPLVDGDGNIRWVLFVSINPGGPSGGSATQYFVGDFDGKSFTPQDNVTRWVDYGADNYAGVTWSDIPSTDGRRLFMGWMSNWLYAQVVPTKTWRSATTLPREVTLIKRENPIYELRFKPVHEVKAIQQQPVEFEGDANLDSPACMIEFNVELKQQAFSLTLSNELSERIDIKLNFGALTFDRSNSGITNFHPEFPKLHGMGLKGIVIQNVKIYVDKASIEVFINDGERVLTEIVFPTKPYNKIKVEKANPKFEISSISQAKKDL